MNEIIFRLAEIRDIPLICNFIERNFTRQLISKWTDDIHHTVGYFIQRSMCRIGVTGGEILSLVMGDVDPAPYVRHAGEGCPGGALWVECVATKIGLVKPWRDAMNYLQSINCKFERVAWLQLKQDLAFKNFDFKKLNARFA